VRAPTVGALGEAKRGEKAQFTRVNEHFEPVFNAAIAESGLVQRSQLISYNLSLHVMRHPGLPLQPLHQHVIPLLPRQQISK